MIHPTPLTTFRSKIMGGSYKIFSKPSEEDEDFLGRGGATQSEGATGYCNCTPPQIERVCSGSVLSREKSFRIAINLWQRTDCKYLIKMMQLPALQRFSNGLWPIKKIYLLIIYSVRLNSPFPQYFFCICKIYIPDMLKCNN